MSRYDPLKSFLQMMAVERNAARPTLEAYGRDLDDLKLTLAADLLGFG